MAEGTKYRDAPIVMPVYQPGSQFASFVNALLDLEFRAVIIVDDGSGPEFAASFEEVRQWDRVHVLHHAVNLGKGAALKTGMNFALVRYPECYGVVTVGANGEYHPEDVAQVARRLAENPSSLALGVRTEEPGRPAPGRMGKRAARLLMRLTVGQTLSDTETGLRGVPAVLIPHLLRVPSAGNEFELDMLIACKYQSCPIWQEPIRTMLCESARSESARPRHHPVLESMRTYLLLARFTALSLLTAALDNVIFAFTLQATSGIAQSQVIARLVAMIFNYWGARRFVFHSRQRQAVVIPKYVLLVISNGLLSYALIRILHNSLGIQTILAKVLAEGFLFIGNFAIQRDFVFTRREGMHTATDWDHYYTHVPATARLTRRYTTAALLNAIRRHVTPSAADGMLSIVEIGGANSCFLDSILESVRCGSYDVVDTNQYGLSLLAQRLGNNRVVRLHQQSVLALSLAESADLVFSVGLVEHFDQRATREAVLAHFDALRPGGVAIITFPRPTLLYRVTRRLIEIMGMWKFPDERPLNRPEVLDAVRERGDVVYQKLLWPLFLTQQLIVAKKRPI
jgi:putative flippase GtrA